MSVIASKNAEQKQSPRVLCCVTHYFRRDGRIAGTAQRKSTSQDAGQRLEYVTECIESCRRTAADGGSNVLVCGREGSSLVPLDVCFNEGDPQMLMYDTLEYLIEQRHSYDYYMMVEDDILIPPGVLEEAIRFDRQSPVTHVLHPNRIEIRDGRHVNRDLSVWGEWTTQYRQYEGRILAVNANPHSAVFVLSAEKFNYCCDHVEKELRGLLRIGRFRGGLMASAFAKFLAPMSLYRAYEDWNFHYVVHQDPFEVYAPTPYERVSATIHGFVPPALNPAFGRVKKWIKGSIG